MFDNLHPEGYLVEDIVLVEGIQRTVCRTRDAHCHICLTGCDRLEGIAPGCHNILIVGLVFHDKTISRSHIIRQFVIIFFDEHRVVGILWHRNVISYQKAIAGHDVRRHGIRGKRISAASSIRAHPRALSAIVEQLHKSVALHFLRCLAYGTLHLIRVFVAAIIAVDDMYGRHFSRYRQCNRVHVVKAVQVAVIVTVGYIKRSERRRRQECRYSTGTGGRGNRTEVGTIHDGNASSIFHLSDNAAHNAGGNPQQQNRHGKRCKAGNLHRKVL